MADFKLLNYQGAGSVSRPGILVGGNTIVDVQDALPGKWWAGSTLTILSQWDEARQALRGLAANPRATRRLSDVKLLAPLLYPPAIYCAGANYVEHQKEMGGKGEPTDKSKVQPYLFLKTPQHCVIGPGAEIRLPAISKQVDWEAELAVVIGRSVHNIKAAEAMQHVAGYTIMNDLSARDLGRRPDWPNFVSDWFGQKNFSTAAPLGPWITPADQIPDPARCHLQLWVNTEKMQDAHASDLIFNVPELIEYVSRRLTLMPGDVIATGTPSGVGRPRGIFLKPGDKVRIEISGIGTLENPVIQGD